MKPIVALIGRPNVGKSTFFNRIAGQKKAIVDNTPGVTRDRNFADVTWFDTDFILVDTGGFVSGDQDKFAYQIRLQVDQAIADADTIILMLDGKNGLSPFDIDLVNLLRNINKPIYVAVNKIDDWSSETLLSDFYQLGIPKLYPVSAEHGYGISDLLDELVRRFEPSPASDQEDTVKISVIGRPNVGKSSLINRLVGENRLVVSNTPGTTRDAIDTYLTSGDKSYILVDTAGIRRKAKVDQKIEKFSVIKALKSMARCDVALIVIDAFDGITDQDIRIAGYALDRACGCIIVLNKWDLVEKDSKIMRRYMDTLQQQAKFLNFAPILTVSALTGQRTGKILNLIDDVYHQYTFRVNTGEINRIIEAAVNANEPSLYKGRRIKFFYVTQASIKPPTFILFVNFPEAVHFSYKRYLINQIREATGLRNTPIRLFLRKRQGDRHKK